MNIEISWWLVFSYPHQCPKTIAGESYPLGIWVNQWASGELTAAMAEILIQEKLGFHVLTGKGSGPLTYRFSARDFLPKKNAGKNVGFPRNVRNVAIRAAT